MALSGSVQAQIDMTLTKSLDLSTTRDPVSITELNSLVNGTGALGVQQHYSDTLTIADGAATELDLAGSLLNAFGQTITFTKIKAIYLKNNSSDADLEVGGSAANEFLMIKATGDAVLVKPGGFILLVAPDTNGYPVTAGTGDLLNLEHDGTGTSTMDVDIYIAGEGTAA